MIIILLVLMLPLEDMQMVIDMEQLYDITTMEECKKMLPEILQEYNSESGYCAYGDIINALHSL